MLITVTLSLLAEVEASTPLSPSNNILYGALNGNYFATITFKAFSAGSSTV